MLSLLRPSARLSAAVSVKHPVTTTERPVGHESCRGPDLESGVVLTNSDSGLFLNQLVNNLNHCEVPMSLRINDTAPNFTADTTQGTISFHDWIGDGWALMFSHPKDFTPVCTTELGAVAALQSDFETRNCKIIGLSVDGVSDHEAWSRDIEASQGHAVGYPLIGDPTLEVVKAFDMLPADSGDSSEGRTPADNQTARSVFIIGPDKRIKATLTYPMSTGRNFDEILRLLDSLQLTASEQVATPANWSQGQDVIILPAVSDEAAREKYPEGWETPLPYIRLVKQP